MYNPYQKKVEKINKKSIGFSHRLRALIIWGDGAVAHGWLPLAGLPVEVFPGPEIAFIFHAPTSRNVISQMVIRKSQIPGVGDFRKDAEGAELSVLVAGIETEIGAAETIFPSIEKSDTDQLGVQSNFHLQ
jgi:hypothetical protein